MSASFNLRAGTHRTINLEVNQASGIDEPLTGDDIIWTMRRNGSDTNALTKTIGSGITVTNEAGGLADIAITRDDTKDLEPDTYHHEALLKSAAGVYDEILTGTIRLRQGLAVT